MFFEAFSCLLKIRYKNVLIHDHSQVFCFNVVASVAYLNCFHIFKDVKILSKTKTIQFDIIWLGNF